VGIRTDVPEYTIDSNGRRVANFAIGAAKSWRVDVLDSTGAAQNMTGWSLAFVIRDAQGAEKLSKTTGGGTISIGNGSGTGDRATVTLVNADTQNLQPGRYEWALWRTDSTNDDPLAFGEIVLARAARQPAPA
jgi:hypothetical protein